MAKVENLNQLAILRDVYYDLLRIDKEAIECVEVKVSSGTVLLPKTTYDKIKEICHIELEATINKIEEL